MPRHPDRFPTVTDVHQAPPQAAVTPIPEDYGEWRATFAAERLRVLYGLGLVANPVFIAADFLLHRSSLVSLLMIRSILEAGLLAGFFVLIRPSARRNPRLLSLLLVLWILIGSLCIAYMTVVLGGFTSQYYNGLNLVFLAAAVIVPISWPSHLLAQIITLSFYYGVNFPHTTATVDINAAIENSFFLVWTCIAVLFSVYLYERLQRAEFHARLSEHRTRQELEASHRKLLELDRLKSEFFANISHELRTPLTLSLGAFRTLLEGSSPPESRELLHSGLRNTSRVLYLINELLDLAKFDSGGVALRKACIDFSALVRSVASNFDSSQTRRVHLKGLSQPVPIEVDARHMKKVLYNLLSNAFKFSDPHDGQVWIRLECKDDTVELEIEDNGIGIPPDQLERVFDRFAQVEGSATRRYEGSGIGLAVVREVVTLHGGTITLESELDRGSIFTVRLPRGIVDREAAVSYEEDDGTVLPMPSDLQEQDASPRADQPAVNDTRALVLVADDNADMRAYLERLLCKRYRLILAKDGTEAISLSRIARPDLILTDVMMPKMSGYDLLKAVRDDKDLRSIPVVFLTARAGMEARVDSLEAGADDYLSKPFDEHELHARVGNLIRARAQERELVQLQKEKIGRFLPPHLADMISSGDREDFLKGHRTEITVLFIDLRGFTRFAEMADPEDLMSVLRQYHTDMGNLISQYGGTLERFAGDSMMVFFNDPLPVPDHAQAAVRMAVAMRDRIGQLRSEWNKRGITLGAGIGIATGYATIGVIGFDRRKDYAAIGPVTNLASRLCSEAQHDQILIPDRMAHLLGSIARSERIGELALKGFHHPVVAYNVTELHVTE
jgi:signal transduction histidine kinase/class 3 adenylate cyclase